MTALPRLRFGLVFTRCGKFYREAAKFAKKEPLRPSRPGGEMLLQVTPAQRFDRLAAGREDEPSAARTYQPEA